MGWSRFYVLFIMRVIYLWKECMKFVYLYTNSWSRFPLDKLIIGWVVNKLHILSNPDFHHICYCLQHAPVPSQISIIHVLHPVSWISGLMLCTLLCLCLPYCVFPFGFPEQKLSTSPLPTHATYTIYLIVWFLTQYFVKSGYNESPHNIMFFIPVLPSPFKPR